MTKDRDYYACLSTSELQDEINYGINVDWHELCVAMAQRIKALDRKLEGWRYDIAAERHDYDRHH